MHVSRLEKELDRLNGLLEREKTERRAERQGRIRAEQQTTKIKIQQAASCPNQACLDQVSFPFRPIGRAQSCFSQRNGTPRQPNLSQSARCRIQLDSSIPPSCLAGLEDFSHCWVLYVFHENNDLAKVWSGDRSGLKAKIAVPRLNGEKRGVFSTRSPHRPSPIGLSSACIVSVDPETGQVVLGGADIVDGSPILDLKPYIPFCDSIVNAKAPKWVSEGCDENEPLAIASVGFASAEARKMVEDCWCHYPGHHLYHDSQSLLALVQEVLSRDLRPVHRRVPSPIWSTDLPLSYYEDGGGQVGAYHVVLEGIDISYDIEALQKENRVLVRGAIPNVVPSQQRGLGLLGL